MYPPFPQLLSRKRSRSRGQTALETFFVFTSLIFFAFIMLNVNTTFFTHNIATYASFMAARSYQVYGNHTGAELFEEQLTEDTQALLESEGDTLTVIRVAEDIMTCGLPWLGVPEEDKLGADPSNQDLERDPYAGCMEGKRRYRETNIRRQLAVFRFDSETSAELAAANNGSLLEEVQGGFRETERKAAQFAILKLSYKNFLPFNYFGFLNRETTTTDENGKSIRVIQDDNYRARFWHSVHMPLLLNPGLESGVELAQEGENLSDIDERFVQQEVEQPANQASANTQNRGPN